MNTMRQPVPDTDRANRVRDAVLSRRAQMPLVFKNSREPERIVVDEKALANLVIDPRVQREEVKPLVNDLIVALQSGGAVLQPLTLGRRVDGTLSVLDGQQRLWAHIHCNKTIRADVWPVENIEEERLAHIILNTKRGQNPNHLAYVYPGQAGEFLRGIIDKPTHPLHNNTNCGKNPKRPYAASVLAKCLLTFLTGGTACVGIQTTMARLDTCFKTDGCAKRAGQFFDLLTLLNTPRQKLRPLPGVGIALIARKRWEKAVVFPPAKVSTAIQKINWNTQVPSLNMICLPNVMKLLEERWKS